MLGLQEQRYKDGEKHLSGFDMIKQLTRLKQDGDHDWMYEISADSANVVCRDLDKAYKEFFKKTRKHPRFKSRKKAKPSYPVRTSGFYFKDVEFCQVPKIGMVKYKTDFSFPFGVNACKFYNVRIQYIKARNIWILTLMMEIENQEPELTDVHMGIDLGVRELATVAYGDEKILFHNINNSKKVKDLEKKLKYYQRSAARKREMAKKLGTTEKSNNLLKVEQKARKIHYRLKGVRNNYIHQITNRLIKIRPKRISMESLNVQNMIHQNGNKMRKRIQEAKFGEFIRQIQYKCEWSGIKFVQAIWYFPSSQICSSCGYQHRKLKRSDKVYICPRCGFKIDRDYNAAVNLMRYAT